MEKCLIMILKQQAKAKSGYLPQSAGTAEPSGGGLTGSGPPHVKSRSYRSIHPQLIYTLTLLPTAKAQRGCGLFGHSWCTGRRPRKNHWSGRWIPPTVKQSKDSGVMYYSDLPFWFPTIKKEYVPYNTFYFPEVGLTAWGFGAFWVVSAVVCVEEKGWISSEW